MCMTRVGSYSYLGTAYNKIELRSCTNNTSTQQWQTYQTTIEKVEPRTTYHIDSKDTNYSLNLYYDSTNITVWDKTATDIDQKFHITNDGQVQLKDKCLDVIGYNYTNNGNVALYDCNNATNQQWIFNDNGTIASGHDPNYCLYRVPGGRPSSSTTAATKGNVTIYQCNASDTHQQWIIHQPGVERTTSESGGDGGGGSGTTDPDPDPEDPDPEAFVTTAEILSTDYELDEETLEKSDIDIQASFAASFDAIGGDTKKIASVVERAIDELIVCRDIWSIEICAPINFAGAFEIIWELIDWIKQFAIGMIEGAGDAIKDIFDGLVSMLTTNPFDSINLFEKVTDLLAAIVNKIK